MLGPTLTGSTLPLTALEDGDFRVPRSSQSKSPSLRSLLQKSEDFTKSMEMKTCSTRIYSSNEENALEVSN